MNALQRVETGITEILANREYSRSSDLQKETSVLSDTHLCKIYNSVTDIQSLQDALRSFKSQQETLILEFQQHSKIQHQTDTGSVTDALRLLKAEQEALVKALQ